MLLSQLNVYSNEVHILRSAKCVMETV